MPRHSRLFIPGATYHVYCRVARGEFAFDDNYEAVEFVDTLREVRDLDGWSVLAWCLMGNHYHLVVKTRTVDLWRTMARLQGRTSRAYNRRHRYLGRLWQSRYRARVVDTNEYFCQVVAYVHLNPVSAGIVDDPCEYVFSGHREIAGACDPHIVDRRIGVTTSVQEAHYGKTRILRACRFKVRPQGMRHRGAPRQRQKLCHPMAQPRPPTRTL